MYREREQNSKRESKEIGKFYKGICLKKLLTYTHQYKIE